MRKYLMQASANLYTLQQADVQIRSLQRIDPKLVSDYVLVVEAMQGVTTEVQEYMQLLQQRYPGIDLFVLPNHDNKNHLYSFLSDRKVHRGYMARFSAYEYLLDTYGEDVDFIFLDPDMMLFRDLFEVYPQAGLYRHALGGLDLYQSGSYGLPVDMLAIGELLTGRSREDFEQAYRALGGTTPYRFNPSVGGLREFLKLAEEIVVFVHDACVLRANAEYTPKFGDKNAAKFADDGVHYMGYISEMYSYVAAMLTWESRNGKSFFSAYENGEEAVPDLEHGKSGKSDFIHLAGYPVYGGYTKSSMFSDRESLENTVAIAPRLYAEAVQALGEDNIHAKFWDLMVHLRD